MSGLGGRYLTLRGLTGCFADQSFRIDFGKSVLIGRSRTCAISLQRTPAFRAGVVERERYLKVSRRHLRISFPHPHLVEIENCSRNGTIVNGNRIDRVIVTDVREHPCEIRFGAGEALVLVAGDGVGDGGDDARDGGLSPAIGEARPG